MSKNIIGYVSHIFNVLAESKPSIAQSMRLAQDSDMAYQKALFDEAKIVEQGNILLDIRYGLVEKGGEKFICLVNAKSRLSSSSRVRIRDDFLLCEEEIGPGYFILLVKGLDLKLRSDLEDGYLEQYILSQHEDDGYVGHSLEDVVECFESLVLFKIEENSVLNDIQPFNVACIVYSFLIDVINLPLDGILPQYRNALQSHTKRFSDNILLSMTATHWKHCFLEIYRCLEGIFPLPRARDLHQSILGGIAPAEGSQLTGNGLNSCVSLIDLASSCHDILGWKSNERDALRLLFKLAGRAAITNSMLLDISFISVAGSEQPLEEKQLIDISEKIYKVRNQLVHQFRPDQEIPISKEDWPKLIQFMLEFWESCFSEFGSAFKD